MKTLRNFVKRFKTVEVRKLTASLLMLTMIMSVPGHPKAALVGAVLKEGNPTCSDFAPEGKTWIELKVDTVANGGYSDGYLNVNIANIHESSEGPVFDWSSDKGIEAVFVKGGPNGNLFWYTDPYREDGPEEETSDTNLFAPVNSNNDKYYGLSHISFCYDIELAVTKTANTSFTRTWEWGIDKTVTPETWGMFRGDSGTSEYTVEVEKTGFADSDWAVEGTISIYNPAPTAAVIESVSDEISTDITAEVVCPVDFPYELGAGGTLECTYSESLTNNDTRTNTATVTTSGSVGGGTGTADVDFETADITEVDNEITVEDSYVETLVGPDIPEDYPWVFGDSGSISYSRAFTCDPDDGDHDNTATIVETDQSDDASVTVNCHTLTVTKDAETALTRTWDWTIEKSADQTELLLSEGQLFQVNYEVTVDAESEDDEWAVEGTISVYNPATTIAATINDVADIISPAIAANVNCGVAFPYPLASEETLNCTYSADLTDATARTNTATATLQNYDYDKLGAATEADTTDFSGTASVDFTAATVTETDECIDLSDTNVGMLGEVCAADAPKTYPYSLTFGKHEEADVILECGEYTHNNIASFLTNDTAKTGSDNWTVNADVACEYGCTLTQGYWKTHSSNGPAPHDDTWAIVGENTTFAQNSISYYNALWTAPKGGNAYFILGHQYIAALLNIENGASVPSSVQDSMNTAEGHLNSYTEEMLDSLKGKNGNGIRQEFITLAGVLGSYNEGAIGPGHCSE